MAVLASGLPLFARLLELVHQQLAPTLAPGAPIKMLSLGYLDFVVSKDDIARVFGQPVADAVTIRADSDAIAAWHSNTKSSVIESDSLYRVLGFEPHYLDVAVIRGGEIVQDLNQPLAPALAGAFDFVLDSGTLEHCFNIAQAVANVAMAVRVGGVVHHGNPLIMINHGFYNFSPAFYHDFYRANGFDVLAMYAVEVGSAAGITMLDGIQRIKFDTPGERTIQVLARKVEQKPIVWPMQSKYAKNPNLKG